jgi:hypothetical protein
MTIEFSRECLSQLAHETKAQFCWAWNNFHYSKFPDESSRWQDLSAFLFKQYCEIVKQEKSAPSELLEYDEAPFSRKSA